MPAAPLLLHPTFQNAAQPCAIHVHCSSVRCMLLAPWGLGLQSQMKAAPQQLSPSLPVCSLSGCFLQYSPPASVPRNCKGWLLYSQLMLHPSHSSGFRLQRCLNSCPYSQIHLFATGMYRELKTVQICCIRRVYIHNSSSMRLF